MSESEHETSRDGDPLDQVREILFGQLRRAQADHVRRIEEKLDALSRALDQERGVREAREAALAADGEALRADLEARAEELRSTVDDLGAHLEAVKVDRERLAGWFEELAQRLREGGA